MTIDITPRELAALIRALQDSERVWKAVDLPAGVKEAIKGFGKEKEGKQ